MSKQKYNTIHYKNYLALDEILSAQNLKSAAEPDGPAHDEMLFIIIHQVYELWFKQIIHELEWIIRAFEGDSVDERNIGTAVDRLERILEILKVLIAQIRILETMTPLDFLDFRNYLFPASGFQSFQFRKVEAMLGLKSDTRMTYNEQHYTIPFTSEEAKELDEIESNKSLFELVAAWLERTPFLEFKEFNFLSKYHEAVDHMLQKERKAIDESEFLGVEEKAMRIRMLEGTDNYFQTVMDKDFHELQVEKGEARLSYKATVAALLINLYRDEPILHLPYNFLERILDIDEYVTMWRYRHAQMVLRMLGKKVGTGGSSGYDYLAKTAQKHHIFRDFHNISTLLIPRSELPELPVHLRKELGFYFTQKVLDD